MSEAVTTDEIRSNIAANLRRAIDDRGWSVATLIEKSGVPQNTVYRILRGENEPSITHLWALCETLGMSMDRIVDSPPELVRTSA